MSESESFRGFENPSIWNAGLSVLILCSDPCTLCSGLFFFVCVWEMWVNVLQEGGVSRSALWVRGIVVALPVLLLVHVFLIWMCEAGNGAVAVSHTAQSSKGVLVCIFMFFSVWVEGRGCGVCGVCE